MKRFIANSLLITLLVTAALPGIAVQAQDDPSALLERVLGALDAVNAYQSYAVSSELTVSQTWVGGLDNQNTEGHEFKMVWREQGTADLSGDNPNIQHTVTGNNTETPFDAPTTEITVAAEIRAVDGTLYINAPMVARRLLTPRAAGGMG